MAQFLSKEDHSLIVNGFCPCCHGSGFILGPKGAMACNVLCPKCRREYNVSRFASEILECVCPVARQREIYHLIETPIEQ